MRHVLLAAAAGLAGGRHLDPHPRRVARPAPRCRQARLVQVRHRLVQRAGGFWGAKTGPNPTDRGKAGSKHHVLTDRGGVPLAATVSAANAHDIRGLLPTVTACPLAGYGTPGRAAPGSCSATGRTGPGGTRASSAG